MKVIICAEEDGKAILSTTLTFTDMEEGLRIASMLQAFARNQWQSSHDERVMKSLNQKQSIEPAQQAA